MSCKQGFEEWYRDTFNIAPNYGNRECASQWSLWCLAWERGVMTGISFMEKEIEKTKKKKMGVT